MTKKKVKVYLISRISEDAHLWNEKICSVLKNPIEVFMPHQHNPYNLEHTKMPKSVFDTDLEAMKKCDIALALPEFGNDCSYEVGWFSNSSKPTVFYIDTQMQWLRDWMVKGGLDYVVTENPQTFQILKGDPILKHKKLLLISKLEDLHSTMLNIYKSKVK